MIITRWVNLRIALIVLVAVLVQVTFFSYLEVFGITPDVVPVVVAAIGLLGGAVVGAVVGFAAGMLLDISLLETLGVTSLVLLSVGYLAGRYRESFEIDSPLGPALVTGALAFLAAAGSTAIELTLGVDTPVSGAIVGDAIIKAFLAFGLAYPIYPLVRLSLRSALVLEEPRTARRRHPAAAKASRGANGRRTRGKFLRGRRPGRRTRAPGSRLRRTAAGEVSR
ncbi:MAG TPA: rod shape-determining protein MreD [Solirubrobacterales bacterium]|nr:rod shape-determining protein MreD [Solirubrobacterales bacterium]